MKAGRGAVVLLAGALLSACSTPSGRDEAAGDDARLAVALCAALRDQTNDLGRVANQAVAGISDQPPDERYSSILAGFDQAQQVAKAFRASIGSLELPEVAETADLRDQVAEGAAIAVDELVRERVAFEGEGATVSDEDIQGRVGAFFNSIEKVLSVVEPSIAGYARRPLQQAFLEEPTCRHVIQPFRLED